MVDRTRIWVCISAARVHFLRDIHDLKKKHPKDEQLILWADAIKDIYHRAVAYGGPDPSLPPDKQLAARQRAQQAFEQELWNRCSPHVRTRIGATYLM